MRKILDVITWSLALNCLLIVGAVGFLAASGKLTRQNITAIKDVLFKAPVTQPTTQPAEEEDSPTTQPALRLEELLSRQSGRSVSEQVEFIQSSFDAQMAQLDRRARELADLQKQVDLANQKLVQDRAELNAEKAQVAAQSDQAAKLANDKGFQDSLLLFNTMPAKSVKQIFATMDDATVVAYLQTMQPRTAAKIIKEFKSPEELARIQRVMDMMRQPVAQALPKEP